MKKVVIITLIAASLLVFGGCGQDINLTVYNDTGILPGSETYCGARVEWEQGTIAKTFTGSSNEITSTNSFTVQVKEGYDVKVYGYGMYYVEDSQGNTTLTEYLQSEETTVYGGYMEAPNWYACLYMDKVLIYKK